MKQSKRIILCCLSLLLIACGSHEQQKTGEKIFVVRKEPIHRTLYFTGTIQPIHESALISPIDAVIESIHCHYGQAVKKGSIIFTLSSSELQKQYNDTLTDYLKAKDSFSITHAKFNGTQELWDAGLISKNNYVSEKSNLNTARVTLIQATRKLTEMLEKIDTDRVSTSALSSLKMAEFDKVRQALATKHDLIHLKALNNGVLLYPPKTNDEKGSKLNVGSAVKSGEVLALIGDLTGIRIEIDIPEMDIDKVQPGMETSVRSLALGDEVLHGTVVLVNAQASNAGNGNLPTFSAVVEVKNLSVAQQAWIKVGMSAAIELAIDSGSQFIVPITAVKQEQGKSIIQIKTQDGHIDSRVVSTGPAQADRVVINAGLNPGDQVVYEG